MNPNSQEDQFRALFADLKRADDRSIPSFETDWAAAGGKKPHPFFAELRYGRLAAAVLIIAGVVAILSHERSGKSSMALKVKPQSTSNVDSRTDSTPVSLETWQSPTAFLLVEPDDWGPASRSTDGSPSLFPSTQPQPRHPT